MELPASSSVNAFEIASAVFLRSVPSVLSVLSVNSALRISLPPEEPSNYLRLFPGTTLLWRTVFSGRVAGAARSAALVAFGKRESTQTGTVPFMCDRRAVNGAVPGHGSLQK